MRHVIAGPQIISYTERVEGGGGSLVGPGASPSSAPTLALAAGSGVTDGSHDVTVVFVTASGRSLPSPASTLSVGSLAAPSSAPAASAAIAGTGPNQGSHDYVVTNVGFGGETTPSAISNAITTNAAAGELSSPSGHPQVSPLTAGGSVDDGIHAYRVTYINAVGETTPGPIVGGITVTAPNNTIPLYDIPIGPAGTTGRRLYRRFSTDFNLVTTISDNTTTTYVDTKSNAQLGAVAPTTNTTGTAVQVIPLTFPLGPAGTTARKIYRRFNGTGTFKLVTTINNNTATSHNDTLANSGLGANAPSTNTALANQIGLTNIAIGGAGTTARELYMSPAGGGARKLALTISNNTATTGTITISDATLAGNAAEPTIDTSGLDQPSGQVLPGATSVVVAGTAPFRSEGGWAATGTQVFRYTGFTGSSLTGIPASGPGSITQPITYNTTIAAAPCLIGIPASGEGSIRYTIQKGEAVNLIVTVEDAVAQVELQALLGADAPVVRECPPLSDQRLGREEALNRANAHLALRAYPGVRVGPYRSKDVNNRVGLEVDINVTTPLTLNDTFQIQAVTISNFTPSIMPDYAVTASDELFSLEAILAKE